MKMPHRRLGRSAATRLFLRPGFGQKFLAKLDDETLHGPGTRLAERTNGPARDIIGNALQQIDVGLASLALRHATDGFLHPQRSFPTGRALAAALVRVKLA